MCDEFRTKTNTNTNFINTENQENVVKYSNLYLRIGKSKFNSALYTWIYYNNAGEKAELFSTNDVNIGSSDSYPYGYAWTSNVSTGNVANCTKDYNNESGDFSKCHSSLMNLNQINNVKKPNGDLIKDYRGINTSTDYVYIYVMADAFSASSGSNPDPKEFTLNIEYTFGPVDTISNGVVTQTTESITVYDASDNNTTISVSGSPSWPT